MPSSPTMEKGKYRDTWSLPGSADRNSIPICKAITPLLERLKSEVRGRKPLILEVSSGMGIQISTIAKENPDINFQPTDADEYLASQIDKKVKEVGVEKNVREARVLDLVEESNWSELTIRSSFDTAASPAGETSDKQFNQSGLEKSLFDGVLVCNLTHISPFRVTQSLFAHLDPRVEYQHEKNGLQTILNQSYGFIAIYGAFNENGEYTSEGNKKFDQSIKERNPLYGLRDIDEQIIPLANRHGYTLSQRDDMPSGNKWLVFRPSSSESATS